MHNALDPVRLLGQIGTLQDALWRHAVISKPMSPSDSDETKSSAVPTPVRFLAATGGETGEETALEAMTPPPMLGHRKYRRTPKPRAPHTWRTRPDPFESVWGEVTQSLAERPELTAKLILDQLQKQHPGEYPDKQLRTLQRRVKEWRASALIQFDDAWLAEEELAGMALPNPLRASVEGKIDHPLDSMAGVRS
jgi:hypothetical protein